NENKGAETTLEDRILKSAMSSHHEDDMRRSIARVYLMAKSQEHGDPIVIPLSTESSAAETEVDSILQEYRNKILVRPANILEATRELSSFDEASLNTIAGRYRFNHLLLQLDKELLGRPAQSLTSD